MDYANVYSNTPNFKGAFSITNQNSLIDNLTSTLNIKWTSAYDFSSGNFRATEEGKGEILLQTLAFHGFVIKAESVVLSMPILTLLIRQITK